MSRMVLETGLRLEINQLFRDGVLQPGKMTEPSDHYWFDDDGTQIAKARINSNMTMADAGIIRIVAGWIDQTIIIVGYPRHFGGQQWYFICPITSSRVAVLWSPPRERFFAGRKAWGNSAYRCQCYGPGMRAHYMAMKFGDRISGSGTRTSPEWKWKVPRKPPGMHWKTYERLAKRCKAYWDHATFAPTKFVVGDVV
jgi:hypothetical protein